MEAIMRQLFVLTLTALVSFYFGLLPVSASAQSHSVSVGYGFGVFSNDKIMGHIEEGSYNFFNLAYQYERFLSQVLGLVVEPFDVAFRSPNGVGILDGLDFAARWLVCVCPCQRSTCSIAAIFAAS